MSLRRLFLNIILLSILLGIFVTPAPPTPLPPERESTKQNPKSLLRRQGVRPANVEQVGDVVELDVNGLDLPVAFVLGGAEDGNAPHRLLGGIKGGLPDQRDLVARVGRPVRDN